MSAKSSKSASAKSAAPSPTLLQGVFDNLTEGVLIAEPKLGRTGLRVLHANPALCRITGYTARELSGRGHARLHPTPADLTALREWIASLPDAEPLTSEGYVLTKQGHHLYCAWTISPLRDARGRLTHLIITYSDQTAQRRLQEALVHAQRLDAVGRLAGGVAHDFNNLLSVINGYCEILQHSIGDNPKAKREVLEIHQAGQRASGLVRQLLAFGRRQALDPRVISPNRLVRENADILSRLLGEERSLELSLDDEVGNIRVDPTQLQQVLLNLVLNARDATRPTGRVVITTKNRSVEPGYNRRLTDLRPGHYVVLTVSDNGCGMDDATQAVLFEPFFTTKDEGMGTGLGLALVYGVVQQSNGHILVQSAPGQGTTFEIYLPFVQEEAAGSTGPLAPLPSTRGRETLLVVEEDTVVRKMVSGILTADGYDVMEASSPAAGLIEVKRHVNAPHLVIVDTADPSDDIFNMLRELHAHHAGLRVLCTPHREAHRVDFIPLAQQQTLPKPFALSALLNSVRQLLDAAL
ncbi:ATP-binding protein [Actomonas aquatica]|uniref:histidine kinase n=1 Tax=Actomonas aquatica TaxID=2866162 RepID=A0ABZ1C421_9BACT|nr:ATP-binding protein [Opitutus sp. WL0086]WRQ86147.1 ATP-binding protein [Opitutus sp. WL0086]